MPTSKLRELSGSRSGLPPKPKRSVAEGARNAVPADSVSSVSGRHGVSVLGVPRLVIAEFRVMRKAGREQQAITAGISSWSCR
jgi:hypothetical protein